MFVNYPKIVKNKDNVTTKPQVLHRYWYVKAKHQILETTKTNDRNNANSICQSINGLIKLYLVLSKYPIYLHPAFIFPFDIYNKVSASKIDQQWVINQTAGYIFAQPPSKLCFKQAKKEKLTVGFISALPPVSGCSPSMCSAKVSNEQKKEWKCKSHSH